MKILLVSVDSKFIHSNLALKYIRNYCKDEFDIGIKEFTINQQLEFITDEIVDYKADMISFSCYIWNIEYIKEIAYIIKTAHPEVKILLGGPEVSYMSKEFMEENKLIDYIVFGEGEATFYEFLKTYNDDKNFSTVKGLCYRDGDKVIANPPRELIHDLDVFDSPYENLEKYDDKIIYYESSRGCPFRCSFCMSSIDKTVRNFSMDRVKRDLKVLLNTNARQIKFVDRTFNADYKRAMEIISFIIENNKKYMTIHFEITADIINEEFLAYLKTLPVNMFQFEVGVQSLHEETLHEINRKMNIEKLFYIIKTIRDYKNAHLHLDLIAGLPYEDYETFKTSFNGIHSLYIDKIQLGFLKVLKGTKIYADTEKHDIRYRDIAPYEVIRTKYMTYEDILKLKRIEELVDKYYNEKYFDTSIKYIIETYYKQSPFDFYEEFSYYWKNNGLYKAKHSRKQLYEIIYSFMKNTERLNDEFKNKLLYDFVYNNGREDLISIFDRNLEEDLRLIKRALAKDESFRGKYFSNVDSTYKIINEFRIVKIGNDIVLFIYNDKNNIFNRCKTYVINDMISLEEMEKLN